MRLDAVRLLVAFCVTPCATDIWLEGPPLKQPGPRAAAPAPKGPASPPESDHAAFVRPPAPHEAWDVAEGEADDEGGVTSLSAAAAHAGSEPGGWRGAIKAVSGRNLGKVAKLVEKGAQEELSEVRSEHDEQEHPGHDEPEHPPSPVGAYHFSKDALAADRARIETEEPAAPALAAAAEAAEAAAAAEEEAAAEAAAAAAAEAAEAEAAKKAAYASGSYVSAPQYQPGDVEVSGCGREEVNGTYRRSGVRDGVPCYRRVGGGRHRPAYTIERTTGETCEWSSTVQSAPLGSTRARLPCLLAMRLAALGGPALPGAEARPLAASPPPQARASRLDSCPSPHMWSVQVERVH